MTSLSFTLIGLLVAFCLYIKAGSGGGLASFFKGSSRRRCCVARVAFALAQWAERFFLGDGDLEREGDSGIPKLRRKERGDLIFNLF